MVYAGHKIRTRNRRIGRSDVIDIERANRVSSVVCGEHKHIRPAPTHHQVVASAPIILSARQ